MDGERTRSEDGGVTAEHVDVLIIGAGISGIGAACHLRAGCPEKTFAILEAREDLGGTWDLFRYPGIRSDSDMFTLGYSFRPWRDDIALADGASILSYVRDTAREHGIEREIRFGHRAVRAWWSSAEARWSVEVERGDSGETMYLTCGFLYGCTGYYRYDEGYSPRFAGSERFRGQLVHPQNWPDDLDYSGKRVVVIGSGATAVTLVPALAGGAEHVTMLQRSPTYIVSVPPRDPLAGRLRHRLSPQLAYTIVRWKNVLRMMLSFQLCRRAPTLMRRLFLRLAREQLPVGYDVDRHLSPTYNPWDQRLCAIPDGDLFKAISDGTASIETGEIETFTEGGIRLRSGAELGADVIVTATGLNLLLLGGLELSVDGASVDLGRTVAYKGMMLAGVPNLALTQGYTNASWTLRADLVAEYVCRLLSHMDEHNLAVCVPRSPSPSLPTRPLMDLEAGYVRRSIDQLPRQGARAPWQFHQNYFRDRRLLMRSPVEDEMEFRADGSVTELARARARRAAQAADASQRSASAS
jgi:monooxygenase